MSALAAGAVAACPGEGAESRAGFKGSLQSGARDLRVVNARGSASAPAPWTLPPNSSVQPGSDSPSRRSRDIRAEDVEARRIPSPPPCPQSRCVTRRPPEDPLVGPSTRNSRRASTARHPLGVRSQQLRHQRR